MSNEQFAPIVTMSLALENLVEALQDLAPQQRERQAAFDSSLDRIRRANVELRAWLAEHQG